MQHILHNSCSEIHWRTKPLALLLFCTLAITIPICAFSAVRKQKVTLTQEPSFKHGGMDNLWEFHLWIQLSKLKVEDFLCHSCSVHLGYFSPSTAASTSRTLSQLLYFRALFYKGLLWSTSLPKSEYPSWHFPAYRLFMKDLSMLYPVSCFSVVLNPCSVHWVLCRW